ncbi:MAG: ABC transporter ATP-binding protein [Candidatus Lokiarchaeota archaeon]|nr:ABC transporter ATP-binding protein [Candidatus Lokiarchaeota archaeon]
MTKTMIKLKNIRKIYDLGEVKVEALKGVSLEVKEREFTVIMGPSGSGKTTLLNMVGALDLPTSGRIIVDGIDITDFSEDQVGYIRCKKIGFIFQFFNLLPLLTAAENVELPMLFKGELTPAESTARAKELLTIVGLGDRIYHRPSELSGGQQQRVAIARSFANNPSLILADEPTGNVDTLTAVEILRLMKRLNREEGQTFVIITHDPGVAGVASRSIYVLDGEIALSLPPGVAPPSDHIAKRMYEDINVKIQKISKLKVQIEQFKSDLNLFLKRKNEIEPSLYHRTKDEYVRRINDLQKTILAAVESTKEEFIFDQIKKGKDDE